ncbi:MAG: hypothetical protein ACK58L_18550 [Planctomycetota bacterium]
MTTIPEHLTSTEAPVDCEQVLNRLSTFWLNEPDDEQSPALFSHLCLCRSCLQKWIALEAAAELAAFNPADVADFQKALRESSGSP